ncbi:zinc-dependent metalloprotease family protein [Balneolales bacterium ANBcel1]|nr:zinc-dependent metalloprotease family protein [Balneolales bacterium ANBcel1]
MTLSVNGSRSGTGSSLFSVPSAVFLLVLLFSMPLSGTAQTSGDTGLLFSIPVSKQSEATLPPGGRIPVSLNQNLLHSDFSIGQILEVPETDGSISSYRITAVSRYVKGYTSVRADHVDDAHDQLTFSYGEGRMLGTLDRYSRGASLRILPEGSGNFKPTADGGTGHVLMMRDPETEDILECGTTMENHSSSVDHHSHTDPLSRSHLVPAFDVSDYDEAGVPIDLLIVYTGSARTWAEENEGSIELVISEMMNRSNEALENSLTGIELRVVHTHETSFEEDGNDSAGDLRRITASRDFNPFEEPQNYSGYMLNVHDLRDEYGADLVAMLADVEDVGGIAWLMLDMAGAPQLGFSVNRIQQMSSTYTFVHEIGHNLGNAHSRDQNGSPAGPFGGLFNYSAGFRFSDATDSSFATVMTYAEGRSQTIGHFSNPEVPFRGEYTGTYSDSIGPADNVRSMRLSRHVVSQYRPQMSEPPVLNVDRSLIEIDTETGQPAEVRFFVSNDGASTLHWNADIHYSVTDLAKSSTDATAEALPSQGTGAPKDDSAQSGDTAGSRMDQGGQAVGFEGPQRPSWGGGIPYLIPDAGLWAVAKSGPQSLTGAPAAPHITDPVLFKTGFETDENYNTGSYLILNDWVAWPRDAQSRYNISTVSPAAGSQHLRLTPRTSLNENMYVGVAAPYPGPLTNQGYSVSMDLRFSSDESQNEFHIAIDEGSTNRNAAWVIFDDGDIIVRNRTGTDRDFVSLYNPILSDGLLWEAGQYFRFEIQMDPVRDEIRYLVDDSLAYTGNLYGGSAPEQVYLLHRNFHTSETFSIDNVSIKALPGQEFPRFQFRKPYGTVAPGSTEEVVLEVIADRIPGGTYDFEIQVHSNDPHAPGQPVPVRMHVEATTVPSEPEPVAHHLALHQNYPNPFNPATTIRYELPERGHVRLAVYDLLGRRVSTLVNERQDAGRHDVAFDASRLSSGVYLYRLESAGQTLTRHMMLVK